MADFKLIDLEVDRIDKHPACDVRIKTSGVAVDIYATKLKDMPPVTVFAKPKENGDGTDHWLADGHHTYLAHIKAGSKFVKARAKAGTYADAYRYASNANVEMEETLKRSGVPVYEGDKKHRVEVWLRRPEAKGMTQQEVAEICGVHQSFVKKIDTRSVVSTISTSTNLNHPASETPASAPTRPSRKNDVFARTKLLEIEDALRANPEEPDTVIAKRFGVNRQTVGRARKAMGLTNPQSTSRPAATPPPRDEPLPGQLDLFEDEPASIPVPVLGPPPPPSKVRKSFDANREFMPLECAILDVFSKWPEKEQKSFARLLLFLADRLRTKTGLVMREVTIAIPQG